MKHIRSWFTKTQTYVALIVIIYFIVVATVNPAFIKFNSLFDLMSTSSITMILALGVFLVLLSGGIDLSFTCIAVFSAYTSARIIQATGINNLVFAFAIAIIIGALLGLINALVIHCFRIPTLIATLGTQSIFRGLMAVFVGTTSINTDQCPTCFIKFGSLLLFTIKSTNGTKYGLSVFMVPVILLILLTWFVIKHTMIGRGIIALGNSEVSAERVGVNLLNVRIFLYVYVGIVSSIAGIISIAQVSGITPISNQLIGGEMPIIAAVVIGGTKLSGGEGTIYGTILGVLLIRLFSTTLVFLGIGTSWNDFVTGTVLVLCLIITSFQTHLKRNRLLLFDE